MKRRGLASLVAGALALGAGLAAAQTAPAKKITLTGGSVGGAWSAIGNAIGETIRRESPGAAFGYEPGREAANIQLVSTGKVELGIAHAQLVKRAQAGEEPFKAPVTNLRAIALIDPQAAVQILVREDAGIDSFESVLAAKKPVRVVLNQRGTLMAVTGEEVFKAYGISAKDIEAWGGRIHHVDYNAGLEMMKNGQADIIINMLAFPSGQINSATREMKVKMLGISPEATAKLGALLGTAPITVPAGTYAFQPAAVPTITGSVVLFASAEMKNEDAALIADGMIKHFDYLRQAHAMMARLEPVNLTQTAPLALHPGAEAAYRKAGLLK
jgi:TRAP transporter TAXI family solute receptor